MPIETGLRTPGDELQWCVSAARAGLALALLLFAGCGRSSPEEPKAAPPTILRVAAASDLQGVLPALTGRFTVATGVAITPVVGASGQLAEQIRQGAPYDVFLSASIAYVRDLVKAGHIDADSVRVYAVGRLVLVVSKQSNVAVEGLADLKKPEVKRIAIANPEFAPYGLAARQTLEKSGLWESLKPKVVQAETVRQAFQFVQSGNAEVGLVAHSVAQDPEVRSITVDPDLHKPILQGLGVISGSKHPEAARRFTDFVLGDEGQKLLGSFGFGPPAASPSP
jgi:molybdate transport system substrate-binding protein